MELCRDNADRALERETAVLSLSGAKLSEQVRTAATSAPGLRAPRPHLHRDWARQTGNAPVLPPTSAVVLVR